MRLACRRANRFFRARVATSYGGRDHVTFQHLVVLLDGFIRAARRVLVRGAFFFCAPPA